MGKSGRKRKLIAEHKNDESRNLLDPKLISVETFMQSSVFIIVLLFLQKQKDAHLYSLTFKYRLVFHFF